MSTFMDNTLEAYSREVSSHSWYPLGIASYLKLQLYIRITENSRDATAAAAIVHKMISRRRPRTFRPEFPFKKGSNPATVIMVVNKEIFLLGQ
jgi:hypothetical protein